VKNNSPGDHSEQYHERSLNILFWKSNIDNTPQVIAESAILKTGRKKTSDSPAFIGDQSGQCVSIIGK